MYQQHGFKQELVEDYELLFVHLARGGCDYISRGVLEITPEWRIFSQRFPNLAIDPHLLVQTPLINYFYLAPGEDRLQATLEAGFDNAVASGAYDELFDRLYGEQLESLKLKQRRVFALDTEMP